MAIKPQYIISTTGYPWYLTAVTRTQRVFRHGYRAWRVPVPDGYLPRVPGYSHTRVAPYAVHPLCTVPTLLQGIVDEMNDVRNDKAVGKGMEMNDIRNDKAVGKGMEM